MPRTPCRRLTAENFAQPRAKAQAQKQTMRSIHFLARQHFPPRHEEQSSQWLLDRRHLRTGESTYNAVCCRTCERIPRGFFAIAACHHCHRAKHRSSAGVAKNNAERLRGWPVIRPSLREESGPITTWPMLSFQACLFAPKPRRHGHPLIVTPLRSERVTSRTPSRTATFNMTQIDCPHSGTG